MNRCHNDSDIRILLAVGYVNTRWFRIDQLVARENELGVELIAGRLIHRISAETAAESVFVIIVRTQFSRLPVRREFCLLVHHDESRRRPRLAWFAHPAPHFIIALIHTAPDEGVARRLGADCGIHGRPRGCLRIDGLAGILKKGDCCKRRKTGASDQAFHRKNQSAAWAR